MEADSLVSESERDRRHREIRNAMHAADIDILLAVSDGHHKGDVSYITNHSIWSQRGYAVITRDAGPFLVVPMASQDYWARLDSWAVDIKWSSTPIKEAVSMLKSFAAPRRTLGVSGLNDLMPISDHQLVKSELPGLDIRDATDLLQVVRSQKSSEEIAAVRESADIASAGFARVSECARPGVSEFEIVAEVERVVRARGAGSTLFLTSQGPYLRSPSARTLRRGDFQMFSVELSGPSGYWVEFGGMLAIGEMDDAARSTYEACQRAFSAGVKGIKVGSRCSDVGRALQAAFQESGHRAGIWGGHGIGLDTLERPRLIPADDTIITEGMSFGFHPHVVDSSGRYGAYIADTVVATAAGPVGLGQFGNTGPLIVIKDGMK